MADGDKITIENINFDHDKAREHNKSYMSAGQLVPRALYCSAGHPFVAAMKLISGMVKSSSGTWN